MHPGSLGTVCSLYLHAFPAVCCPPPQPPRLCPHRAPCGALGRWLLISKRLSLPSPFPPLLTLPRSGTCVGQCSRGRQGSLVSCHSGQALEGGPRDHSRYDGNTCSGQPRRLPGCLLHSSIAAELCPRHPSDLEMGPPCGTLLMASLFRLAVSFPRHWVSPLGCVTSSPVCCSVPSPCLGGWGQGLQSTLVFGTLLIPRPATTWSMCSVNTSE